MNGAGRQTGEERSGGRKSNKLAPILPPSPLAPNPKLGSASIAGSTTKAATLAPTFETLLAFSRSLARRLVSSGRRSSGTMSIAIADLPSQPAC